MTFICGLQDFVFLLYSRNYFKKTLMEKPRHMQILNESNKHLSSVVIWEKSYLWKELAAAVTSILRGRDVTGC